MNLSVAILSCVLQQGLELEMRPEAYKVVHRRESILAEVMLVVGF